MKLTQPLFLDVQFLNIKTKDKKAPAISVRINLHSDDVIYVANNKSRMEVVAYEASDSGLFVTDVEGVDGPSVYNMFRLEAIRFARKSLDDFIDHLNSLDEDTYKGKDYKPKALLINLLNKCLIDRQEFYADLQKQINLVASRNMPRVNEYLVFEDDDVINYPVTARVPYLNPQTQTLTDEEHILVDKFLDVFLDDYNKYALSWYLGAALCNLDIHDDRISKLAIVSSSKGGSGKSTLMSALSEALFTNHYREIKDEFDSFFYSNNKFGVSSLSSKRMSIYSEAKFANASIGKNDEEPRHDFTGMNVSVIKSLITEGYVSSEAKFGHRGMEQLNGFHLVLTNHPPIINQEHEAMNRRILPLMIKADPMIKKAKALGLWGQRKLIDYVVEHRQAFANYFVTMFKKNEYMFSHIEYDHSDYVVDITDSQTAIDETNQSNAKALRDSATQGIIRVLESFDAQEAADTSLLRSDILEVLGGGGSEALRTHIRKDSENLYINSSKGFLIRYGNYSNDLRNKLKGVYGEPMRKYKQRMFTIPIPKQD